MADLYLLKFVRHDWSDESCVKILSNIRRAMDPGARPFIVEMIFTHQANSISTALMDVAMLFSLTGQEREISQFETLLRAAGLAIVETTALHQPYLLGAQNQLWRKVLPTSETRRRSVSPP